MKKIIKVTFIFVLVFLVLWLIGFYHNEGDPFANYGFSYAISKGEIPYLDFNIISTPLFAFYGAIGLLFFNNYIVFLLEQTLIVTISIILLEKLYNKKIFMLLLVSAFFQFSNIIPTYNFFCIFMMIILLFLEKKYPDKDYLIGLFIGLAILSKHTVGLFFVLPSIIFYYKDIKKLFKRIIFTCIPLVVFFIYLVANKALYDFIDLSMLGLLNFSSDNSHTYGIYFYLSIICIVSSIYFVLKNKSDITYYYLFFSFLFAVPIFDFTHFSLYIFCYAIMILPYVNINDKSLIILSSVISVSISVLSLISWSKYTMLFTTKMKHFEYNINCKNTYEKHILYSDYINKFDNPIVIGYYSMAYDIMNDNKIDYFDVLLNGNYGHEGSKKMIKKINSMNNQIFVVSIKDYNQNSEFSQFSKEIAEYIISNYKKIDSKYEFEVYYKE